MARYVAQRLLLMIPTILLITAGVFALIMLIPGDPVMVMLGQVSGEPTQAFVSTEAYQAMRTRLGLDQPLYIQYLTWLGRALSGDLGVSLVQRVPVWDLITSRLSATLYLAVASLLLGFLIAIPGGLLAAVHRNSWVDHLASGIVLFGICTPNFWVALLLVLTLSIRLHWLPSIGYTPPQDNFGQFLMHIAMPSMVLGVEVAAGLLRFVRADVLDQLRQDYVRTARAKGVPERMVFWKHTLKNSMVAATTVMGFQVAHLLGGATIVETVFAYPGVAYLMIQSIFARDFVVVQGVVLFLAITVLSVNFLVDILYGLLNPRIRYG